MHITFVISCFQTYTEVLEISRHSPEELYVRTQMSKWEAPDILSEFLLLAPWLKTQDNVSVSSCENTAGHYPEYSQGANRHVVDVSNMRQIQKLKNKQIQLSRDEKVVPYTNKDVKRAVCDKGWCQCRCAVNKKTGWPQRNIICYVLLLLVAPTLTQILWRFVCYFEWVWVKNLLLHCSLVKGNLRMKSWFGIHVWKRLSIATAPLLSLCLKHLVLAPVSLKPPLLIKPTVL